MTAPDQCCSYVRKVLAKAPSTRDPKRAWAKRRSCLSLKFFRRVLALVCECQLSGAKLLFEANGG